MGASTECAGGEASPTRYLRQVSLDLRGAPPSPTEYRDVAAQGRVTDAMIDAILRDTRFLARVKRWHQDLLWPNIGGFELTIGARLTVVPPEGGGLTVDNINPEWLVAAMDRRTDEPTCPAVGTVANLTAASCCTSARPDHPACCLVRNTAYNPDDPACVAKSAALPATFNYGVSVGDRPLRGGPSYLGCGSSASVEYPPPRVAADDRRWTHDSSNRPFYISPRTGLRRYFYDQNDIPLPYQDATHCPNYCRRATGSGDGGAFLRTDYVSKTRAVGSLRVEGDAPGATCPAGFVEVTNPCDNAVDVRLSSIPEHRREGWRLTRPFWARNHWVKTCAYETQERAVSVNTRLPCELSRNLDSSCGCGPSGAWCAPFSGDPKQPTRTIATVLDAINREPLEIVGSVVERDEDYSTVFTTRRGMANGSLAFMNRYQTDQMGDMEFSASAPPESLPDVALDDPTWHPYLRATQHSGVLTTTAYLARFPTLRSRINRFRTVFLCRPFVPSADPPPPVEDPCNRETNLARRCGCQHCHTSIEPLGAAWGRWSERGARFLDPNLFPTFDPSCAACVGGGCPARCIHYVTTPYDGDSVPFLGTLQAYLYRSPEEVRRINEGPRSLVIDALASGALQSCTARSTWQRLLNRPMSAVEEASVLPTLVRDFEAHGRSYRALVRAIVTSPAYRRID